MRSFILGIPKGKLATANNVQEYSDMQTAAEATDYCCAVSANDINLATGKFMRLYDRQHPQHVVPDHITEQLRNNQIGVL